ncbi:MAG: di-trans,poly-cis-decaprenylcistransferase [Betaproteobacteria bacterium]|nr:MAG: di-trans,poly-cis-decaprenylcistransferase [Betaproteobacteria bacterium]
MTHVSSTQTIPQAGEVPRHVAIIMDGNGRWAHQRGLPRFAGHQRGVEAVRRIVRACSDRGVGYLTLFAFSSENWRRPAEEVALLMQLFIAALTNEVRKLHRNRVRLRVIGDITRFDAKIQALIASGEQLTAANTALTLTIAANYGGRWDILQALARLCREQPGAAAAGLHETQLAPYLSMAYAPEPDLFIRTGGEQRVSNFLLWHLAYTELYFTDRLWPDFDAEALETAFAWYRGRERRFGRTSEQLESAALTPGQVAQAAGRG